MATVATTKPAPKAASSQVNSLRCEESVCASDGRADMHSITARRAIPRICSGCCLESDFTGELQIGQKHFFGLAAERSVFDDRVELIIDRHAERIKVGRSNANPAA